MIRSRQTCLIVALIVLARHAETFGETLTIRRFASDDENAKVVGELRWDVVPLATTECSDTAVAAKLEGMRLSVSVNSVQFKPTEHEYDSERGNTIDGRASLGHDGIYSADDANINFSNSRFVSDVTVRLSGITRRVPRRHFVFMLNPHFADGADCGTFAYWVRRKALVVVVISGGDGAGAYTTYLLFDRRGFRGQYSAYAPMPDYFFADSLDFFGFDTKTRKARLGFAMSP